MSEILVNTIKKADGTGGLTVPTGTGTVVTTAGADFTGQVKVQTASASGQTPSTDADELVLENNGSAGMTLVTSDGGTGSIRFNSATGSDYASIRSNYGDNELRLSQNNSSGFIRFNINSAEKARFNSGTGLLIGTTNNSPAESSTEEGVRLGYNGGSHFSHNGDVLLINRTQSDGGMVQFRQAGTQEGEIRVSGTTVSYNGGHLARWSRLADDSKDTSIVKGTVMTNLDAMVEWGDEANEQLNKMEVSSVEGDVNAAGVFVSWDEEDDWNDMNIAMTGDMVIRIAQGTTVARGDLLMSAGDGTAKPQGDDIVRSKTIAKVTSINVSHTYDDGSYLVPCVLMAC